MKRILWIGALFFSLLFSCSKEKQEYDLAVSVSPKLSGKIVGSGKYLDGAQVVLKAIPNGGYIFAGWKDEHSGRIISSELEYTFDINKNYKLVASFSRAIQLSNFGFNANIQKFKEQDAVNPPEQEGILFIGSSSFTFWTDVNEYFPDRNIINRAFGGSTMNDLIYAYPDIVTPYHPKQVVIYCGENDIAFNENISIDAVVGRFKTLYNMFRKDPLLGSTINIAYVSMKPSPAREKLMPKFVQANEKIKTFLSDKDNTLFIDVYDALLNKGGKPDPNLFLPDQLHNNPAGYAIWKEILEPYLLR